MLDRLDVRLNHEVAGNDDGARDRHQYGQAAGHEDEDKQHPKPGPQFVLEGAPGPQCQSLARLIIIVGKALAIDEEGNARGQADAAGSHQLSDGRRGLGVGGRRRQRQSRTLDMHRLILDIRSGNFRSGPRHIDQGWIVGSDDRAAAARRRRGCRLTFGFASSRGRRSSLLAHRLGSAHDRRDGRLAYLLAPAPDRGGNRLGCRLASPPGLDESRLRRGFAPAPGRRCRRFGRIFASARGRGGSGESQLFQADVEGPAHPAFALPLRLTRPRI